MFKLVGIVIVALSAALVLRALRPELSLQVSIAACILLLLAAVSEIAEVRAALEGMLAEYGLNAGYFGIVFKVIGIAYLAQFAAQLCQDAGQSAMAAKVELCGRVMILVAALPAMQGVLALLQRVLQA